MKNKIEIKNEIRLLQKNISQLLDRQLKANTSTEQVFYKVLINSDKA